MVANDRKLIAISILAVLGLVVMIGFIGQGNVRPVKNFWAEKVEQTVAFEDVHGEVQILAISGFAGEPNPHLISRTSFAYILTVINNGERNHRLFIEGLEVQSDLLEPGPQDVITIYPTGEGIYKYFDKHERLNHLEFLEIKTVVPNDEFTGFLKNMI